MDSKHHDSAYKAEILDIIKQLKVNGSFDQFRKDCFSEILTQPIFQTLKKNVEDFVIKYLNDQKPNTNAKKAVLRDNIRRSLMESYFMNDGIRRIIEEIVEPKLEATFLDKIDTMVNKECMSKDEAKSSNETSSSIAFVASTNLNSSLNLSSNQFENKFKTETKVIAKVKIEDFIPIPSEKTVQVSAPATASNLKHEPKKPAQLKQSNLPVKKEKIKQPESIANKTNSSNNKKEMVRIKSSSESTPDKPTTSKSLHTDTDSSKSRHATALADDEDTDLEADLSNDFNFKWELKIIYDSSLDNVSMSSVHSTDLSDF